VTAARRQDLSLIRRIAVARILEILPDDAIARAGSLA
jgi:hypothetical protein